MKAAQAAGQAQKEAEGEPKEEMTAGAYLFTTKTCPNCKAAKEYLKDVDYQVVDAEENPELSSKLGIMQAPTLVLVKDGKIQKFVNVSNIRRYTEERKQ